MYYKTPNFSIAHNPKVASSSISRAIIRDFWPTEEQKIQTAAYPADKGPDTIQVHFLCPKEREATKPVVLIVREPIARFRSAMAQMNLTDADATLMALETKTEVQMPRRLIVLADNEHFKAQCELAQPSAHVFRLEDLDLAATYIGLTLPLPVINEAVREKPTLTPEQEARVLAYYAQDKVLYDAIPAGESIEYIWTLITEPEIIPVPASVTATQIRLWLVRHGISMQQIYAAISAIPDQQFRAEAEVQWEYAPYIERTNPLVEMIAAGFNMDIAAIDSAFREASLF